MRAGEGGRKRIVGATRKFTDPPAASMRAIAVPGLWSTVKTNRLPRPATGAASRSMTAIAATSLQKRHENEDEFIQWFYRYSLSRSPTTEELAVAKQFLTGESGTLGTEDFLWTVFMLPEFQFIR